MKFDIFKNGKRINSIIADKSFCDRYCSSKGYTYSEVIEDESIQPDEITIKLTKEEYDKLIKILNEE